MSMADVFIFLSTALEILRFIPTDTEALPKCATLLLLFESKTLIPKSVASYSPRLIGPKSSIKFKELPSIILKKKEKGRSLSYS